ncbi:NifU family protein [Candidatus Dependentiae bacterium Noda2021]|nr:NifU family protein [Candidatus Dependentiae bacterium Noda2021]
MPESNLVEQIVNFIEEMRPAIKMDGGDLEFVKYQDGIVYVKLKGACVTCPASMYTLKLGVEERLKELLPEVQEVVSVDDE